MNQRGKIDNPSNIAIKKKSSKKETVDESVEKSRFDNLVKDYSNLLNELETSRKTIEDLNYKLYGANEESKLLHAKVSDLNTKLLSRDYDKLQDTIKTLSIQRMKRRQENMILHDTIKADNQRIRTLEFAFEIKDSELKHVLGHLEESERTNYQKIQQVEMLKENLKNAEEKVASYQLKVDFIEQYLASRFDADSSEDVCKGSIFCDCSNCKSNHSSPFSSRFGAGSSKDVCKGSILCDCSKCKIHGFFEQEIDFVYKCRELEAIKRKYKRSEDLLKRLQKRSYDEAYQSSNASICGKCTRYKETRLFHLRKKLELAATGEWIVTPAPKKSKNFQNE